MASYGWKVEPLQAALDAARAAHPQPAQTSTADAAAPEAAQVRPEGAQSVDHENEAIISDFVSEYDKWDKVDSEGSFIVGKTSSALLSLGLPNKPIIWGKKKILKIIHDHTEMTDEIIKKVPGILANPIIVMKSRTVSGRYTMFGDLFADGIVPVLVVLEPHPKINGSYAVDVMSIASAYGKDTDTQHFIDNSKVLYLDENRADAWGKTSRLQLPLISPAIGSADSIAQSGAAVNTSINENGDKNAGEAEISGIAPQPAAPIPPETLAAQKSAVTGKEGTTHYDAKNSIGFHYVLVDADGLIASNDMNMQPNPHYPQELQPRDRTRRASAEQVQDIAKNLNHELLTSCFRKLLYRPCGTQIAASPLCPRVSGRPCNAVAMRCILTDRHSA